MSNITIYHNSSCDTSRNTLEAIRSNGTEPTVIPYLEIPPSRDELVKPITNMGAFARALLHENIEPCEGLDLAGDKFTDDQLTDFTLQHPILINHPIVMTPFGIKLCCPSGAALDILPDAQKAAFIKEGGEKVVGNAGKRLR